ncbi:MAG: cell envelope biogenesis protein TolA [Beijerinckiaceae bacterium]|nr:cell envelope biogenesis protein TolA [Beijerinckiaceae bacterium]MCI0735082.1 cell envelope biogenesis protein TolA [Beijerinckiaceae bacterium]
MALPENPGFAVSGGVHIGLLAVALISFSQTPQLSDAQESIPVAVLSNEQFSQIMKGEKTAAEVQPQQRSEKIAETAELTSKPSPADAHKDVLAPPSPLKRQPEPGQAEPKEAPKPAQSTAAPPSRPVQDSAKPPEKPQPSKQTAAPQLQPRLHDEAEAALPDASAASRKPPPKFKPDQLTRLLEREKQKETQRAAAKPKSGEEANEPQRKFDLGDIAKFLNKETPQRKQARGSETNQLASLGSPTASAAKMSPSLWDQLDGLLQEQYKRCWSFAGLGGQQKYIPEIHVQYQLDGALIGHPELLNPPADPNLRALAESAMRAVRRCDPLRIPAQYQPYYDQWKGRIVRFDPEEML